MADVKISALPTATSLTSTDVVPIVQGGTTKKILATSTLPFYDAKAYGWLPDGTDQSTAALALLTTVYNAGGGTIYFAPSTTPYRCDSQLLIPNTGGSSAATQVDIRLTGAGGGPHWENGSGRSNLQQGASILDLRYQGNNNGKIETEAQGSLQIDNLTITDNSTVPTFSVTGATLTNIVVTSNSAVATFAATLNQGRYIGATWQVSGSTTSALNGVYGITATSGTTITFTTSGVNDGTYNNAALTLTYAAPFVHSTYTTLRIHDCSFVGAANQTTQDAIVLGGSVGTYNATPAQNDPFNGYGTIINHNSFGWLNRGLYLRTYANDVIFDSNIFVRHNVGTTAAIEGNGSASSDTGNHIFGCKITNNLIETENYVYPIKLTACQNFIMTGNSFYDTNSGITLSYYRLNSTSYDNIISFGYIDGNNVTTKLVTADDTYAIGVTTILGGGDRKGANGYGGHIGADIARGLNVSGLYDSTVLTTGYPGQLTVADRGDPTARLSLGVLSSNNSFVIDAYHIGTGAETLSLNPAGGTVSLGGHITLEGVTSTGATGTGKLVFDTSPVVTTPNVVTGLKDANNNSILTLTPTASAVQYLDIGNAASGNNYFGITAVGTGWSGSNLTQILFNANSNFPKIEMRLNGTAWLALDANNEIVTLAASGKTTVFAGKSRLHNFTVAGLATPTPTTGDMAYVTDGDSGLAWGATVVNSGSGATKYMVWYNGSAWTVVGK